MRRRSLTFLRIARSVGVTLVLAACNNGLGGFSGSVGSTPPGPPQVVFKILGTPGIAFTASVTDARSSWQIQGTIPLGVTIVNDILPAQLIATKLASDNSLLSVQISKGGQVVTLASTHAPGGTVSVKTGGKLVNIAPAANPDLRITVLGPDGELFTGLIEDIASGFLVQARAPATFLFDSPSGKVDGQFTQVQNFGPFTVNMTLNGAVVAQASGGPDVTIVEP
jgi:hypothetical protein